MYVAQPWNSYRKIATQTAPPGPLILMLFEGALRSLNRALDGFALEDPAEANMTIHNNLARAQDIIRELDLSLNMEQGGEVASTLRQLYHYFDRRLCESNNRKQPTGVEEVIHHLTNLRDAWASMLGGEQSTAGQTVEPAMALATA
jgi:flagellar secretion chaperone FliS